jgi:Cu/Ag efflux protein CusF
MKTFLKIGAVLLAAVTMGASSINAQAPPPLAGTNSSVVAPKPRARPFAGKVTSVDTAGKAIEVTLYSGTLEDFQITDKTRIINGKVPATLEDLKVGTDVRVSARKNDAGEWAAVVISIKQPKKAAASTNAPPPGAGQ